MTEILSWIPWLTTGGLATGIAVAFFLPSILPTVVVGVLKAVAETIGSVVQYLGGRLGEGLEHIFANCAAVMTLIVGVLAGGVLGDRYEWVRPYIPSALQSESGQVKAVRAKEAAKHKAKAKKPVSEPSASRRPAGSDIMCNLLGNCTR